MLEKKAETEAVTAKAKTALISLTAEQEKISEGVDQDFLKANALRAEDAQQQFLRPGKGSFGKTFGTETVLIRHHHQLITGGDEALQRR